MNFEEPHKTGNRTNQNCTNQNRTNQNRTNRGPPVFFYFTDAEEAHAAAEERKRVRKLRSRRDRCKNGAQFTQNLYPDFR